MASLLVWSSVAEVLVEYRTLCAHLILSSLSSLNVTQGLLRALDEYGIPIDHIAGPCSAHDHHRYLATDVTGSGTSIGALIGGLYAREGDVLSSAARAKKFSSRMGNIWRVLSDVTYPIVAYTTVGSALSFFVDPFQISSSRAMSSTAPYSRYVCPALFAFEVTNTELAGVLRRSH